MSNYSELRRTQPVHSRRRARVARGRGYVPCRVRACRRRRTPATGWRRVEVGRHVFAVPVALDSSFIIAGLDVVRFVEPRGIERDRPIDWTSPIFGTPVRELSGNARTRRGLDADMRFLMKTRARCSGYLETEASAAFFTVVLRFREKSA